MDVNKIMITIQKRISETYQKELDKIPCKQHNSTAIIGVNPDGQFGIKACCQEQYDMVYEFLRSRSTGGKE
ncbi:hypothetical protein CN03_07310 [Thalassolituus oleivorans]|nr:hypothetical protein CN03_07310 [Thalassolituus oleivorans]